MSLPARLADGELQDPGALPFSEAFRDALDAAHNFALSEKADHTRRAYAAHFRAFYTWCESVNAAPLPASAATVSAYLATLADRRRKVSTIDAHLAAIAYAHKLKGLQTPTSAEPVKAVLRGIRRRLGSAPTRKAPATHKIVARLLKRIPADTRIGLRDRALILLGFAAALRRSELVALNLLDIERTTGGVFIHIRKSKTDQTGLGHQVAVPRGKLGVIEALDAWIQAAGLTEGALFCRITRGGNVGGRLSDKGVARAIKNAARGAGLNPAIFSGHSLRAGFVTSALEAGADVLKVMDVTRHESVQTLKGYDRRARAFKDHAGGRFL